MYDAPAETGGRMKLVPLKYDYVFREVFSHESIRKQFISDVTGIPLNSIKTVHLTTPYLWRRYRNQKQGILDVAVIMNDNTKLDIELQVRFQKHWEKRSLFYLAKMYTEDLKTGQRYDRLRKCILISILDFNLTDEAEYHSVYTLRDAEGRQYTDLLELHIIELTKELGRYDAVDDWIRLFNAESLEELDMIKTRNAGIREAMGVMRAMSIGKRLRRTYEVHMKMVRDRWAEDDYVRDEGRKEGQIKGKAEAILVVLNAKGKLPDELRDRILAERDPDTLDRWIESAATAGSIQEFVDKENL